MTFLSVNKNNSTGIVYIKGDENTDGSIRITLNLGDAVSDIEKRENGIWNPSEFKFNSRVVIDDNTGNTLIDSNGDAMVFQ